jgi:hypothetical protein
MLIGLIATFLLYAVAVLAGVLLLSWLLGISLAAMGLEHIARATRSGRFLVFAVVGVGGGGLAGYLVGVFGE